MSETLVRTDSGLSIPPLPGRAVLLHMGFHKTGTTAIQDALTSARPELVEYGIAYPGRQRAHHWAAFAFLDRTFGWRNRGGRRPDHSYWPRLVQDVGKAERAVVSSEFFTEAKKDEIAELVAGLGGDRVHVVATLRSLHKLLPSSWQQYLKGGLVHPYETWLRAVLADPPEKMTPTFWRRHRHGRVLKRWSDVLGPERVTLIVLDDDDRSMLYRCFEQLLGLPEKMLEKQPRERENRGLTAVEAEFVRQVNLEFQQFEGASFFHYNRIVQEGTLRRLVEKRTPPPDEPRIVTPAWALERAAQIGSESVDLIRASGIRVIGDLDSLIRIPPAPAALDQPPTTVPLDAAVTAVIGTFASKVKPPKAKRALWPDQPWKNGEDEGGDEREPRRKAAKRSRPRQVIHRVRRGVSRRLRRR